MTIVCIVANEAGKSINDKRTGRVVTYAGNIDLDMPSTGNFSVSVSDLKGFDGIYFSEGTGETVTTNKGNEVDVTPSSNHSKTSDNPGLEGKPNSSVDILDKIGNIKTRRWYGPDGKQYRDVDYTNHGNPNRHPEWPHEHGPR